MLDATRAAQNLRADLVGGAARIDDRDAPGLRRRTREVGGPDALEELLPLHLEAIVSCPVPAAALRSRARCNAELHRHIEQQRQIRTRASLHQHFQLADARLLQAATRSLIGVSRVGEAIAQHPAAERQVRLDQIRADAPRARRTSAAALRHRAMLPRATSAPDRGSLRQRRAAGFARHHVRDAAPQRAASTDAPSAWSCPPLRFPRRSRTCPAPALIARTPPRPCALTRHILRDRGIVLLERGGKYMAAVALGRMPRNISRRFSPDARLRGWRPRPASAMAVGGKPARV